MVIYCRWVIVYFVIPATGGRNVARLYVRSGATCEVTAANDSGGTGKVYLIKGNIGAPSTPGDLDGDGIINTIDLVILFQQLAIAIAELVGLSIETMTA